MKISDFYENFIFFYENFICFMKISYFYENFIFFLIFPIFFAFAGFSVQINVC